MQLLNKKLRHEMCLTHLLKLKTIKAPLKKVTQELILKIQKVEIQYSQINFIRNLIQIRKIPLRRSKV
jgi:hypothetical protein